MHSKILVVALILCPLGAPAEPGLSFTWLKPEVIAARLARAPETNALREAGLRQLFEEAGCTGERLVEQPIKKNRQPNVICSSPGETDSVIVVGAHFDFVDAAKGRGVVDNWSGAALLPSLFEDVQTIPHRKHTFVFVGFTEEETGLRGSKFYVKSLGAGRSRVKAMVDLDTLGLSPTKIWAHGSDKALVSAFFSVANALKLPASIVNVEAVGTTDSQSFMEKKIPALAVHSVTQQTLTVLHSKRDTVAAVQQQEYYDTYHLLAGYLAYLDQQLD